MLNAAEKKPFEDGQGVRSRTGDGPSGHSVLTVKDQEIRQGHWFVTFHETGARHYLAADFEALAPAMRT